MKRLEQLGLDGGGMSEVSEGQVGAAQCNVGKSFCREVPFGEKQHRGGAGRRDGGGPLRLRPPPLLLLLWLKSPLCFFSRVSQRQSEKAVRAR